MITNNKILIIAKREYKKIITSKGFWAGTLLLPLLMVVIGAVSVISQDQLEAKLQKATQEAKLILIVDDSKLIATDSEIFSQPQIKLSTDLQGSIEQVRKSEADAVIYYPSNLTSNFKADIYSKDEGILSLGKYDDFASSLVKNSVLAEIKDPAKLATFNAKLSFNQKYFKDGSEVDNNPTKFIIPFVSIILYFLFTSFATNYLLMSVSEEKENRMIEIILSSVHPKELIWGKILGQVGVILSQMVIFLVFALLAFKFGATSINLPIDLSNVQINPLQVIIAIFYIVSGFLILANTMVGSGAAMPTYRDAQSFSTIFIMLSIFPIYAFAFILADPNGILSYVTSYFPYSAPIILLLRNALGAIGPIEMLVSMAVMLLYIYITGVLAYKLFEFGALEYNQKISFKSFLKTFKLTFIKKK